MPAPIVKCPHCMSDRIHRISGPDHAGPMDQCKDCGSTWPTKPGSLTKMQDRINNMPVPKSGWGKEAMNLSQEDGSDGPSLNHPAFAHAMHLIKLGNVDDGEWSFDAEDENELLVNGNWPDYAKWFLGVDDGENAEDEDAYSYPIGKAGKVYLNAIYAIEEQATQQELPTIADAAIRLKEAIQRKAAPAPKLLAGD